MRTVTITMGKATAAAITERVIPAAATKKAIVAVVMERGMAVAAMRTVIPAGRAAEAAVAHSLL